MKNIIIDENSLQSDALLKVCKGLAFQFVIITDDNVASLYGKDLQRYLQSHFKTYLITITSGEQSKTRETKAWIEDQLFELGCGRDTCIIALGGGVVTDLAGFVAATFCRGIPAIYLPTSLLAMVDAAIGGKTGVNTTYGKNLIGSFTQPHAVIMDVQTLKTLPEHEYRYAFSEVIKLALVYDSEFFDYLNEHAQALKHRDTAILKTVIQKCCQIKSTIVEIDTTEKGLREILNFGHTIAHAIERLSDYQISHGQAVAMGIMIESQISAQLGHLSDNDLQRITAVMDGFDLLTHIEQKFTVDDLCAAMRHDKKSRQKQLRMVLLARIGSTHGTQAAPIEVDLLEGVLKECYNSHLVTV